MKTSSNTTLKLLYAGIASAMALCLVPAWGDETPQEQAAASSAAVASSLGVGPSLQFLDAEQALGDDELSVTTGRGLEHAPLQGQEKVGVILWDEGKTPCCTQGGGAQAVQMQGSSPTAGVDQLRWIQR